MIIFPAIDLFEKKAVRLFQGNYREMTVYSDHPLSVARDFVAAGASHIHLVDLEGAKDGTTPNLDIVTEIAEKTPLFTEIGGGIRNMETVARYLERGVDRVILGTAAVKDPSFLLTAVERYGERIAVGADVRDGKISIHGWTQEADLTLDDFMASMQKIGVQTVICTDISKDGAMRGTNRALYQELSARYAVNITASGGVSALDDITALRQMNLYGAIIGKAYYTGAIDLKKAIEVAR